MLESVTSPSTTRLASPVDFARSVALNLRDRDLAEVTATGYEHTREQWADHIEMLLTHHQGPMVIRGVSHRGRPTAVGGAIECWPGVWAAWMVATPEWPKVALKATRMVRHEVLPAVWAHGAHRIEARSVAGYDAAHRWLKFLGAQHECTLRGFGREGQDFEVFAWRPRHV